MIHVNQLFVFSGPSCSGKSSVIKKLQDGDFPLISTQLRLGNPRLWKIVAPNTIHLISESHVNQLVLHYDFLRLWKKELPQQSFEEDVIRDLLHASKNITFITLWVSPEILIQRVESRYGIRFDSLPNLWVLREIYRIVLRRRSRYHTSLYMLYRNKKKLLSIYNKWFDFCLKYHSASHWIMDNTGVIPKLLQLSDFSYIIEQSKQERSDSRVQKSQKGMTDWD